MLSEGWDMQRPVDTSTEPNPHTYRDSRGSEHRWSNTTKHSAPQSFVTKCVDKSLRYVYALYMTSTQSTFTATARQELAADFTELLAFADHTVGKYMDEYGDTKEQAVARFVEHMQAG